MWCSSCQQDVPASQGSNGEAFDCPRCGESGYQELTSDELLRVAEVSDAGLDLTSLDFEGSAPPLKWNNWELDDELRRAQRITRDEATPSAANEQPAGAWLEPFHRAAQSAEVNAAATQQVAVQQPVVAPQAVVTPQPAAAPAQQSGGVSILGRLTMSLGLVAFAFGAAILVWSRMENRLEFWDLGLATALGGQFLLLVGVLFWIDRVSRARSTAATATANAASPTEATITLPLQPTGWAVPTIESPSSAFYAHLTGSGNTQRMVADLQGQLDLLAHRISSTRP